MDPYFINTLFVFHISIVGELGPLSEITLFGNPKRVKYMPQNPKCCHTI